MIETDIAVILGTAHLGTTPGKRSPDGQFRECMYSREIVKLIKEELEKEGIVTYIDYLDLEPNSYMKSSSYKQEQSKELQWRVNYVNNICNSKDPSNFIYVSVHVNAAGADGQWKNARGWCVYTSPGKTKSDTLATCLFNRAKSILPNDNKNYVRSDFSDGDPDYESNFYVLTKTKCPAVLTENLFQDNKQDVQYLQSEEGKKAIVDIHVKGIIDYVRLRKQS